MKFIDAAWYKGFAFMEVVLDNAVLDPRRILNI